MVSDTGATKGELESKNMDDEMQEGPCSGYVHKNTTELPVHD